MINWPLPPYTPVNINFSTSGNQTIVPAYTSGGVGIYGFMLVNASSNTSTVINFYLDGGSTSVASTILFSGGGTGWNLRGNLDYKSPYFITNNNTAFVINSSASVQIYGVVYAANCP